MALLFYYLPFLLGHGNGDFLENIRDKKLYTEILDQEMTTRKN